MYDADTCPGEYVDAGFQKKKLARLCEFFLLQKMCEKAHPRGKMREGADSFVKNAERLNGLHFPAAERSDYAQGKTTPRLRRGRREEQITTRRRRFPKQKHSTSVGCFCFVHDESDFSNVSLFADETTRRSAKRRYNRLLQVAVRFGVLAESIFGGVTCGVPGRRGCNTPMLGDVRFIKLYPLTSAWERKIFLKQEDKECFLYVGDGAKKT